MNKKNEIDNIYEARETAEKLNEFLQEDTMPRLQLYQESSLDRDVLKWTPGLYRKALLADVLCKKLDSIISPKKYPCIKKIR